MMLGALARAYAVLECASEYLTAATKNLDFIRTKDSLDPQSEEPLVAHGAMVKRQCSIAEKLTPTC